MKLSNPTRFNYLYSAKVHSFLKHCFAQSSVDTICWYFQLSFKITSSDISSKYYHQIVSTEDRAKHCFKNEWTFVRCLILIAQFLHTSGSCFWKILQIILKCMVVLAHNFKILAWIFKNINFFVWVDILITKRQSLKNKNLKIFLKNKQC